MGALPITPGEIINGIEFIEWVQRGRGWSRWRVRCCTCRFEFQASRYQIKTGRRCILCWPRPKTERSGALVEVDDGELIALRMAGIGPTEIAKHLSQALERTITKNMVCGRLFRLGVTRRPPRRKRRAEPIAGGCLFPLGHPDEDDFHYCGEAPLAGRDYCPAHHKLTHLRFQPRSDKSLVVEPRYLAR